MPYPIKKFAHFLVMQYSNIIITHSPLVKNLDDFKKEEPTKHICNSIDKLSECYKKFIDVISIEDFHNFAQCFLITKPEYVQFLIKGCFKLCEDDRTFFEFLLVCVYICKMSNILFAKYQCYKILKVTANTLELLYTKEFSNYFKEKGGFSGFSTFCKHFNDCPTSENYANGPEDINISFSLIKPEINLKVRNFKYLDNFRHLKKIKLDDSDLKFLEDEPYLNADNRGLNYLLDWKQEKRPMDKKSCSCCDTEMDMTEFFSALELATRAGCQARCRYCLSQCYNYPFDLKNY